MISLNDGADIQLPSSVGMWGRVPLRACCALVLLDVGLEISVCGRVQKGQGWRILARLFTVACLIPTRLSVVHWATN